MPATSLTTEHSTAAFADVAGRGRGPALDTPASAAPAVERGIVVVPRLRLEHGGEIRPCDIAYEVHGRPGSPLVIALGGISASRHLAADAEDANAGWWEEAVGPRKAIDTTRFRALGIDWIGGAGASTGPARDPAARTTRRPTASSFPLIDTRDQARAIAAVLDHLRATRVHAIIGASYGGMVALAFASLFPDRVDHIVSISAAHEPHPMATALRSLQRSVVRLGIETGRAADSLRIARGIAMTTYRTPEEFAQRFARAPRVTPRGPRFEVEDYLDSRGTRFANAFPAESFLALSESIDLHSVEPERIAARVTLVGVASDTLVPPWQLRELAARLPLLVSLAEITSVYGHDAFLKEVNVIGNIIANAGGLQ